MEGMIEEEEKCCGNCCWFYGEMTDGDGICAANSLRIDDLPFCNCSSGACEGYVSIEERDEHLDMLRMGVEWLDDSDGSNPIPPIKEYVAAVRFAFRYIDNFSKI